MMKLGSFGHILAFSTAQSGQAVSRSPLRPLEQYTPPSFAAGNCCSILQCIPAAPELHLGAQKSSGEAKFLFYRAGSAAALGINTHVETPNLVLLGQKLKCC